MVEIYEESVLDKWKKKKKNGWYINEYNCGQLY